MEAGVVVVAVGVVFVVEVGDGAGAVAFSAAGGKVVSAGVAGSAHSLEQALNSAPPLAGLFLFSHASDKNLAPNPNMRARRQKAWQMGEPGGEYRHPMGDILG